MPKNQTMRITGGSLVRRRFLIPPLVDEGLVRPTPDRVREAVFSMLIHELAGALVLDLFAGSGAHGFEAISRGATRVLFVEKNPKIAAIIKENAEHLGVLGQCVVTIADALSFIKVKPSERANIIFVDPPYALKLGPDFFEHLAEYLAPGGVIVFRCFKKEMPALSSSLYVDKDRVYGGTRVFIIRSH